MTERKTFYSGELINAKEYQYSLELKNYNSMLEYVQAFQWNLTTIARTANMIVDYLPLSRDDKPEDDNGFKHLIEFIEKHNIFIDVRGQIHSPLYLETDNIQCLYDYSKVKEYSKEHTIVALDHSEYNRLTSSGIDCSIWFEKVRINGNVISQKLNLDHEKFKTYSSNNGTWLGRPLLYVDDILGGGATLKMAHDVFQEIFEIDSTIKPKVHVCYKEKIFKYDDLFDVTYDFIY